MIIKFPTGLYTSQIPQSDSQAGSVAWTISTDLPAQSNARFLRLPLSEEIKKRSKPIFTEEERRAKEGDLIFTSLKSNVTKSQLGQRAFDLGEILEFTETENDNLAVDSVPSDIIIQHNDTLLDYTIIGLTQEDINEITNQATAKKKETETQLNSVKSQIEDTKSSISDNQKKLNEVNKVLDALTKIYTPEQLLTNSIYQKLIKNKNDYIEANIILENNYNLLIAQSRILYDSLLQISNLVK